MRGCISLGYFYDSQNMILGPAIDEAAQYYEKSNWIGAFSSPSVHSALLRMKKNGSYKNQSVDYVEYQVPMKDGGIVRTFAIRIIDEFGEPTKLKFGIKTVMELIHQKLEKSRDVADMEKWKNTLEFMYFLEQNQPE